MISILTPTRGRRDGLVRMVMSALQTASRPSKVEIVAYVDMDDEATYRELGVPVLFVVGPRIILSDCWNQCLKASSGNLLMMGGDDMVFRTPNWDVMLEEVFQVCEDGILMAHGDDGICGEKFSAFPCVSRKWAEITGYFVPPVFVGDYADMWLFDIANVLKRRRYVPFLVEHLHYTFGKSSFDQTYRERKDREVAAGSQADLYESLAPLRAADVEKLRKAIRNGHQA